MDLTESVRKGGAVHDQGNMGPEAPIWVEFREIDGADVGHGLGRHGADRQYSRASR